MSKQLKADLALLGVAMGWGASFILSKNSLSSLSTYNFLAIRFLISFFVSAIIFHKRLLKINKDTIKYGILVGFVLFGAYATQTVGLNYTTASKSAFITGFSVVLVPMISALILKKTPERSALGGALLALIGLGFLTLNNNLTLGLGDFYTLLCAFGYALHIITVGKYTVKVDSISFGVIQIGVVGFLSLITTFFIETPIIPSGATVWTNMFILSMVCTSGAYIVQSAAQKYTTPTHTALIYTGEPVFAAMFAFLIAGEVLSLKGFMGAFLILMGMLIAEVDLKALLKNMKTKEKRV